MTGSSPRPSSNLSGLSMPVNYTQNSDAYIADLLNPDKGYVLIKNYFSDAEIDQYRTECERFLHTGPVCGLESQSGSGEQYRGSSRVGSVECGGGACGC